MGDTLRRYPIGVNHAVAVEPVSVAKPGYFMLGGPVSIEGADQVSRNSARDLWARLIGISVNASKAEKPGFFFPARPGCRNSREQGIWAKDREASE